MRPSDFMVPAEERAPIRHEQGLSHEQLQELQREQALQTLRQRAAHRLRSWQKANPGARFAKDTEQRIFEELLADFEKTQAEAAAAREDSARNAEELAQGRQAEREKVRQGRVQSLLELLGDDVEPEAFAGAVVDLLDLAKAARVDPARLPELLKRI